MMATEQDLETGKEEEDVSRDLPNQGRAMVSGKEAIDQFLQEDPKEALLVEVTVGDILEEGITGNPLETAMTGQDLEIDTQINLHTIREGQRVIPETVIRARMGRGVTEADVKEEALTEVQVRKEKVTEEEMMIVEEREKVRSKMEEIANPDASVADQRVTWLSNVQSTNQDPLPSVMIVNLITKPLNVKPDVTLTTLR